MVVVQDALGFFSGESNLFLRAFDNLRRHCGERMAEMVVARERGDPAPKAIAIRWRASARFRSWASERRTDALKAVTS